MYTSLWKRFLNFFTDLSQNLHQIRLRFFYETTRVSDVTCSFLNGEWFVKHHYLPVCDGSQLLGSVTLEGNHFVVEGNHRENTVRYLADYDKSTLVYKTLTGETKQVIVVPTLETHDRFVVFFGKHKLKIGEVRVRVILVYTLGSLECREFHFSEHSLVSRNIYEVELALRDLSD